MKPATPATPATPAASYGRIVRRPFSTKGQGSEPQNGVDSRQTALELCTEAEAARIRVLEANYRQLFIAAKFVETKVLEAETTWSELDGEYKRLDIEYLERLALKQQLERNKNPDDLGMGSAAKKPTAPEAKAPGTKVIKPVVAGSFSAGSKGQKTYPARQPSNLAAILDANPRLAAAVDIFEKKHLQAYRPDTNITRSKFGQFITNFLEVLYSQEFRGDSMILPEGESRRPVRQIAKEIVTELLVKRGITCAGVTPESRANIR